MVGRLHSSTPVLPGKSRGAEIKAWLAECAEIESFVILDDDSDMDDLSDRLVKTKTDEGLLATHILEIIKILDTPIKKEKLNENTCN